MKLKILFSAILLFSFVSNLQAHGRTKKHRSKHRSNSKIVVRYHTYPRWHHNYWHYDYHWNYRPSIVKKSYKVDNSAEAVCQLEKLYELEQRDILTEKEYDKQKKKMLDLI